MWSNLDAARKCRECGVPYVLVVQSASRNTFGPPDDQMDADGLALIGGAPVVSALVFER